MPELSISEVCLERVLRRSLGDKAEHLVCEVHG